MIIRLRHDAIVRTLRRNGSSTVSELAAAIGVSRRTMLRDIAALRDQGFIIHSEPGRGGGIQLDPESLQTTSGLSVIEVFALLISVATMRAARSLPFADLADSGLSKIEKSLSARKVRDLRRLLDCLHVGQLSSSQEFSSRNAIDPALMPAFETAFLQRLHLRFHYCDAKGTQTVRQVETQAMLILPPLWYLVAWDPAREDFRHFRMDRISSPEVVEGVQFRTRHVPFQDDVCPFSQMPR